MRRIYTKPNKESIMILYHVTNPLNRESILTNGLIPSIGESQSAHLDNPIKRVYMCNHNEYDSTWDDDRYLIHIPEHIVKLTIDCDVKGGFYTEQHIKADWLEIIHEGTGVSTL